MTVIPKPKETSDAAMEESASVEEELAHVNKMLELLASNRVWLPGFTKEQSIAAKCALVAALLGLLCLGAAPACFALGIGEQIVPVAIGIAAAILFAGASATVIAVLLSHNRRPQPAFVLDSEGCLWCVFPESDEEEPEYSQKEIITLREQLDGYAKHLTNPEVSHALHAIRAVLAVKGGKESPGYDVSLIEDIEGYGENDEHKQKTVNDELVVLFSDRISGERQELRIDRGTWQSFVSWLDEEFSYYADEK